MAVHLKIIFILVGVTGVHSVITVSKVSVKAGDSITIPCRYGSEYMDHVKYLCKGSHWKFCSYAVKTNQPRSSGKFSISDDKKQRIFTVTIKDLTNTDTDYWCIVEINGGADDGQYFHLSITTDTPSLSVDHQEITGFIGESINISCYYRNSGQSGLCRLGKNCVTGSSGSIDGTSVTIRATVPNVFTVTMNGLKTESSGWYYCVKGELQMPVHVTVTERPTTTTLATRGSTTLSPIDPVIPERSASINLKSLIIPLSVLIFIVIVSLFIWFMMKKHKQSNAKSSAMTMAEEGVTYCNVGYKRETSGQRSHAESDMDVMYDTVVTIKQQTVKRAS
ncbi:CMRF35-like molecule 8 [Seriola lalandi dorsalis]|uniref:CMRF35-like molecule 8 n=1 Tax=Seriola lalandi dorsalis TaxID=1841481 RepID=UPI000C6FB86B|nr:CMRF35-like molecule 8 [Seriola lalandi dorsalis]